MGCDRLVTEEEWAAVVSSEDFDKYRNFMDEIEIKNNENQTRCPQANCSAVVDGFSEYPGPLGYITVLAVSATWLGFGYVFPQFRLLSTCTSPSMLLQWSFAGAAGAGTPHSHLLTLTSSLSPPHSYLLTLTPSPPPPRSHILAWIGGDLVLVQVHCLQQHRPM